MGASCSAGCGRHRARRRRAYPGGHSARISSGRWTLPSLPTTVNWPSWRPSWPTCPNRIDTVRPRRRPTSWSCVTTTMVVPNRSLTASSRSRTAVAGRLVELGGRLVGEEQARPVGDGHRQRHPLLLAARQRRHRLIRDAGQPERVEEGERLEEVAAPGPGDGSLGEADVVGCRPVGQEVPGRALEHEAHPIRPHAQELPLGEPADLVVADPRPPGRRRDQAAEHPEQRGLARPGRAEQGHALARRPRRGRHRGRRRRRRRPCGRCARAPRIGW